MGPLCREFASPQHPGLPRLLPGQVGGGGRGEGLAGEGRFGTPRRQAGREGAGSGAGRRAREEGPEGWGGAGPASSSLDKTPASLQRTTGSFSGRELPARGSGRAASATRPGGGAGAVARGDEGGRGGGSSSAAASNPAPSAGRPPRLRLPLPVRPPMAAAGQLWLLYLSAGLLPRLGAAFNLDTREDNVIRRTGEPGSLFGFSLAMHQQLKPEDRRL